MYNLSREEENSSGETICQPPARNAETPMSWYFCFLSFTYCEGIKWLFFCKESSEQKR